MQDLKSERNGALYVLKMSASTPKINKMADIRSVATRCGGDGSDGKGKIEVSIDGGAEGKGRNKWHKVGAAGCSDIGASGMDSGAEGKGGDK